MIRVLSLSRVVPGLSCHLCLAAVYMSVSNLLHLFFFGSTFSPIKPFPFFFKCQVPSPTKMNIWEGMYSSVNLSTFSSSLGLAAFSVGFFFVNPFLKGFQSSASYWNRVFGRSVSYTPLQNKDSSPRFSSQPYPYSKLSPFDQLLTQLPFLPLHFLLRTWLHPSKFGVWLAVDEARLQMAKFERPIRDTETLKQTGGAQETRIRSAEKQAQWSNKRELGTGIQM